MSNPQWDQWDLMSNLLSESSLLSSDSDFGAATECVRKRNAVEPLAAGTRVNRRDIKHYKQDGEQAERQYKADDNSSELSTFIMHAERHVRHQRKPQHQTEAEPNEMRIIIDHR